MWLTLVLIHRLLPLQPNTPTLESGRSNVHILMTAFLEWGQTVDGLGWNRVGFPAEPSHIFTAEW